MLVQTVLVALASSSFVFATTTLHCSPPKPTPEPIKECTAGHAQCCNSVAPANSSIVQPLLDLKGIVVKGVDVLVGLSCTPIDVVEVGSSKCTQQAVCCQDNQFNGVINVGCTPINL